MRCRLPDVNSACVREGNGGPIFSGGDKLCCCCTGWRENTLPRGTHKETFYLGSSLLESLKLLPPHCLQGIAVAVSPPSKLTGFLARPEHELTGIVIAPSYCNHKAVGIYCPTGPRQQTGPVPKSLNGRHVRFRESTEPKRLTCRVLETKTFTVLAWAVALGVRSRFLGGNNETERYTCSFCTPCIVGAGMVPIADTDTRS